MLLAPALYSSPACASVPGYDSICCTTTGARVGWTSASSSGCRARQGSRGDSRPDPRSSTARQRGPSRRHAGHAAGSRPRSWAAACMATM